jgi:hypothetical protein
MDAPSGRRLGSRPHPAADPRGEALIQLRQALKRLTAASNGQPADLDCWADDEACYLEADLPEMADAIVDISIFAGRCLIRIQA